MSTNQVIPLPAMSGLTSALAAVLRGVLAERRITGISLARQVGLSQSAMSRRLTGEQAMDTNELDRVLVALGMDFGELLERLSRPTPTGPAGGAGWASRGSNPEPAD